MELSTAELLAAVTIVAFGGYVRGFSGFGSSLIWAGGLTLFLAPSGVVPTIFVLEVAASASLITKAWADVDWASMKWLVLGALIGTPVGTAVLRSIDDETMAAVVSITVIVAAVVLAFGFQMTRMPRVGEVVGTGLFAGVLNGATAAGGPPVIVLFLGTPTAMAVSRASLIAFFGLTDIWGIGNQIVSGGFNQGVVLRTLLLLVPMIVFVKLGEAKFGRATERQVRTVALAVLAAIGVVGLVRALL